MCRIPDKREALDLKQKGKTSGLCVTSPPPTPPRIPHFPFHSVLLLNKNNVYMYHQLEVIPGLIINLDIQIMYISCFTSFKMLSKDGMLTTSGRSSSMSTYLNNKTKK